AGQAGQRPCVGGRRHERGVVPARPGAVPLARAPQHRRARPAVAAVGTGGRGVPRRGGRLHLARAGAGDLRGVPWRARPLIWCAVSAARTPRRDKTAVPRVPAGTSGPPASGAATSVGTGGWAATAARYAPAGVVAAAMLVLGFWGIARHNSMGNDEVATRWAALLGLRELAHLLGHLDAVHGLYYLLMHGWMALGTTPTVM